MVSLAELRKINKNRTKNSSRSQTCDSHVVIYKVKVKTNQCSLYTFLSEKCGWRVVGMEKINGSEYQVAIQSGPINDRDFEYHAHRHGKPMQVRAIEVLIVPRGV